MYRIQLSGNSYIQDKEIGMHYQLHRGIGIHQTKASKIGKPLKFQFCWRASCAHICSCDAPSLKELVSFHFTGYWLKEDLGIV